ncbi:transcription factor TFIIIB component B'' homolog isoform X1 [Bos indicus x Bos taurus]|uniref:transcription factor TFIIIB component B'' homolog isoform X1 n=1 Tax=Bos indicus x Bos taurus TaxID=30522 RepID=UPI000F7D1B4D|nr:transcription factor TFIIIB component B'' homolog isoform X1 [Bos indicus x Bos taurus]
MFRRARLSVKPNVRPGAGARASTAPSSQREQEVPRPQEPAAASAPKPAESTDVPPVDFGEAQPQEKTPKSSVEKTDDGKDVEESSKPSSTVSQRRKRIPTTSSLVKPSVSVPSEPHPLSTVNQEAPQPNPVPTKEKQPCSDRYRIYKAQKLREMLKEELRKEKKQWKNKYAVNETQRPLDRSKMTMRDFIYYLPESNPMTSSLEQEKKTEKSSTPVRTREQESKTTPDGEDNEEIEEELDDGPLLVPRVKVAEDGSIILDEESLTVEVLRTKGPCVVEENDPIFERGSTTTYSSFRKSYYSKPWSNKETDMFFLAISMVGTDFSMIGQLFPHRARIEIKNKFKREEKTNGWRIDKAFQEKRPFDFDFFAHLLQKVLAEEEKRKQKSVKNQSSKEKKSSKSRKNAKVKKVANDDRDESVSTKISNPGRSQKDAQTVEEELQSLTLSEQDSEQNALGLDVNQKKRRRKNQGEGSEQEVHLSGSATVQPGSSKGEKHRNKGLSLSPEINEDESSKEQELPCVQDTDDLVDLSSSEDAEQRTDPVLSPSQQDVVSVAAETAGSNTSDLLSSEGGAGALCEVNSAESSRTEERDVDLKDKSLETDQTETVKPMTRGRLQRPKPNLSRAVGKKSVLSRGKTDAENKSLHKETPIEKNPMEKDCISGMENTEKGNPEPETVSNLSEKTCVQEDDQPKAFRPARLMRGLLQRPKPNVGKAAERKETVTSQEKPGASIEKNENESCINRDTPEQLEDQSCENFECEDIASLSEKKDNSFQNVQSDDPKAVNECLSIQEDNRANKDVRIPKTRFQKPKPNIGRRTGRRGISSKEEVPKEVIASEAMTAALRETATLETSLREKEPVETNTTEEIGRKDISSRDIMPETSDVTVEMETDLKETEENDISPREKMPEISDVTVEMKTDLKETEKNDISPMEKIPEMIDVIAEMETDLKETGKNDICLREKMPEMSDVTAEMETDLKETEKNDISPREKVPEMSDIIAEMETDLKETGKNDISPREKMPETSDVIAEMETDLKETRKNDISPREKMPETSDVIAERETDLKEARKNDISPRETVPDMINVTAEMGTDLKETGKNDISPREKIPEMIDVSVEIQTDSKETGKNDISPREKMPEMSDVTEEMWTDMKETEKNDISSSEKIPEMIDVTAEMETDLKETGKNDNSPREKIPETNVVSVEMETDLKENGKNAISPREKMLEMSDVTAEMETDLKVTGKNDISPREKIPEMIDVAAEMETDLKETGKDDISPMEKMPETNVVSAEMEADLKGTGKNDISPREKMPEMSDVTAEMETDLKETRREIFPREEITVVTDATEERKTDLEETERREMSLQENAPEEVDTIGEVETDSKKTEREISPNEEIPEMPDAAEEVETDLEETDRREISTQENASEVKTVGDEMEIDLKEIGIETCPREKVLVGISATGERETDLEETGQRDIFLMRKASAKVAAVEEIEADLKDTGKEISLTKSRSEEIEKSMADLENIEEIDISLREKDPEDTGTSSRAEADPLQTSSDDSSTVSSLTNRDLGREVLSVVHTSVEEKNSEKEVSNQLSHLNISSQSSELDKVEDQRMRPPSVPEQFSDINLSKSLPQEQTPCEIKLTPFVRSRFKRPKPNLARAASKRETTKAEKHAPGKEAEADKTETVVIQQNCEQMSTFPSQHDVASLMTSREKDKLYHGPEETVILPCVQTKKDLSTLSSCESKEESQSTQAQEKELLVSMGTHNINTFEQGIKERVIQTAPLVRGRLQRPRPNLRKAGQRQVIEISETKETTKEEKMLQKDETGEKFLTVPNSQIATETEVVSSEVSEGRVSENQSHVLLENLHINKVDVLGEKMRHGHETYVPSPPQMIRRQFQRATPDLGRAQSKKEASDIEEDRADQRKARKPEDSLSQHEDSDSQLLQKGKPEFLTSLEVSARKDSVGSKETELAKKDDQSEVEPSGSVGEKTGEDNSVCAVVEKQCVSKPSSPQLLKEPDNSKIALDRRRALSSASEREIDRSRRRVRRKVKPSVPKGRGSKRSRTKTSKKEPRASRSVLVTLRASQEEDEDDGEDFDYEEESYHLAPEEVNKAPVFVPIGLRSPEPVPVQIEETMEELVIPTNVTDVGCITVVEHQLSSNIDVIPQEMRQEENLNTLSVEMTVGGHSQAETESTNDGSTEAAITLLTMGDLVLQSEISPEQSDGICILPDAHSIDQSHIPFSPDNVNLKTVHECQEPSSSVHSTSPSVEENKIVLDVDKQNTKEEIGLTEEVKENTISSRTTTSEVTNNLRKRSRFAKPKPNLKKILGTKRFGAHQKVPSLFVTKGEEVEIQRETEKNASQETALEGKNLGSVTATESTEQSKVASVHGIEETSISQETHLTERGEDQERRSEEVPISSVAPAVYSESGPHTCGLGMGLGESSVEEPLGKDFNGDPVLTLNVPKCIPTGIPEVQQENVNDLQDLTVNLVNVHQDGEDEQAFILTLVEIPTHAVEEYADSTVQLMPNPLLPAPILVKSANTKEREDTSISFPVTSVGQDDVCLSNSERDGSENSAANLDLVSRKRYHCSLDESDHVPPAKKTSLTSIDDCQKYTSEVCSKELTDVLEETGESYKGQDIFPTSGNIQTISEPQKEQLEPASQSIRSGSLDKITDTQEQNASQLPQDETMVSDKEERTCTASESEQMGSITSSSNRPLTRPGRRPLGFLSLICSKNSLDSDEATQVHSKKRLKPVIPVSRQNLKRSNLPSVSQKKTQESSDVPSPSVVDNTQPTNNDGSATQVSHNRPLPKGECKGGQNRVPEEEPTTVSEYFFNDIFIEVDETE